MNGYMHAVNEWHKRIQSMDKAFTAAMGERLGVVDVISNDGEMVFYHTLNTDGTKRLRAMTTWDWDAHKKQK